MISVYSAVITHVTVRLTADTKEIAETALAHIYDIFAAGRVRYVRTQPQVSVQRDFDQDEHIITGRLRFSFKPEAGDETVVINADDPAIAGFAPPFVAQASAQ